jgi:hypothetical protein
VWAAPFANRDAAPPEVNNRPTMEQVATTILSAMLGGVIVAFVAPWIQHHFWKRQRYAELCLLRIDQVAKASNKFISSVRRWHDEKEKWQRERIEFFWAWKALAIEVRALVSTETGKKFSPFDLLIEQPALI